MEDKKFSPESQMGPLHLLKFTAVNGFIIVLHFAELEALKKTRKEIEDAGRQCEQIPAFNPRFDQADMFIDMRKPAFTTNFDLEDWL